jgi:hypothetical protein
MTWACVAAWCFTWSASPPARAQESSIVMRGGLAAPEGEAVRCTPEGVVVRSAATGESIVGWHHVREVRGPLAEAALEQAEVADRLFRARARLARGDVPAAEPLFEALFAERPAGRGPTSAAVARGLLMCRLDRGAHTLAVGAWLALLGAERQADGVRWASGPDGSAAAPAIDADTGLAPDLPPVWLGTPSVRVFGEGSLPAGALGERERALEGLYRYAARIPFGDPGPLERPQITDAGVRLVWDVVAAQSPDGATRLAGRRGVESRLGAGASGWEEAWLRAALGRSLVLEAGTDDRRRGVIELLRVRLADREAPYLAGLALAEAAVTLRELGDEAGASTLRRELLDEFAGHPATRWGPISDWGSGRSASSPVGLWPEIATGRSPHG